MIEELSVVDVKGRLANYILRNSKNSEQILICDISISKKELAKSLGTIPETLSRTLKFLKSEKIIEENDEGFIILDKDKLKKLTE
jgi:CRP/FNR family transcriptional regulator